MKNVILLEFKLDLVKNAVITCKDIFLKQHNRFIASGILASKPKRPESRTSYSKLQDQRKTQTWNYSG